MRMYERNLPPIVNVAASMFSSDLPAARKGSGAAGHSHKTHPCNVCFITLEEVNSMKGYDIESECLICTTGRQITYSYYRFSAA